MNDTKGQILFTTLIWMIPTVLIIQFAFQFLVQFLTEWNCQRDSFLIVHRKLHQRDLITSKWIHTYNLLEKENYILIQSICRDQHVTLKLQKLESWINPLLQKEVFSF